MVNWAISGNKHRCVFHVWCALWVIGRSLVCLITCPSRPQQLAHGSADSLRRWSKVREGAELATIKHCHRFVLPCPLYALEWWFDLHLHYSEWSSRVEAVNEATCVESSAEWYDQHGGMTTVITRACVLLQLLHFARWNTKQKTISISIYFTLMEQHQEATAVRQCGDWGKQIECRVRVDELIGAKLDVDLWMPPQIKCRMALQLTHSTLMEPVYRATTGWVISNGV